MGSSLAEVSALSPSITARAAGRAPAASSYSEARSLMLCSHLASGCTLALRPVASASYAFITAGLQMVSAMPLYMPSDPFKTRPASD